jgi:uncharacterized protein HemX
LYRGTQHAALQQAVARWSANPERSPALTGIQRAFLQASERADVRSSRRRQSGFAILALLTALAVTASGVAFYQRAAAVRQRDQAIYNQVVAEALQFETRRSSFGLPNFTAHAPEEANAIENAVLRASKRTGPEGSFQYRTDILPDRRLRNAGCNCRVRGS